MGNNLFEYTLNNHFKSGYEGDFSSIAGRRSSPSQKWSIRYGQLSQSPMSWRSECISAAQKICSSTPLIPNILFSGGLDSEIVVRSFMEAKESFNITIIQFPDNLNIHDISFAISFCEEYNLSYNLLPINPLEFWESELNEIAHLSQCFSPQLCLCMYAANQLEGLPVIGNGNMHISLQNGDLFLEEGERWSSFNRYFIAIDKPCIPGFFQYSPEMVAAFIELPGLINSIKIHGHSKYIKHDLYSRSWKNLRKRPKYTGFEKLQDQDFIYRSRLKKFYGDFDEMIYIPIKYFNSYGGRGATIVPNSPV